MGNGCGPDWMPRWIKSLLFDWFHEASCDKHDEGYIQGGDEARRLECDTKFLAAMKRDSLQFKGLRRLVRLAQAYAFYALVRIGGQSSFNYTEV